MLSEHPNVRVHGDPAIMCPAREVTALAGTAKRQGVVSWVSPFFRRVKKGDVSFLFLDFVSLSLRRAGSLQGSINLSPQFVPALAADSGKFYNAARIQKALPVRP